MKIGSHDFIEYHRDRNFFFLISKKKNSFETKPNGPVIFITTTFGSSFLLHDATYNESHHYYHFLRIGSKFHRILE